MEPMELRLIVRSGDDGWIDAQMLELDIAVRASGEAELLVEIQHAICAEYHLARNFKRTPFINLTRRVPDRYESAWDESQSTSLGILQMDAAIVDALAMVLHAPIATFTLRELKSAA